MAKYKYTIAIDPSINDCGLAIFNGKKLIIKSLLKPDSKKDHYLDKCRSMISQIESIRDNYGNDYQIVTEIPMHFGSSVERGNLARESGAIYKLTFLCGMIYNIDNDVIGYEPREWKGQMPKDVVARRLQKEYPKENIFNIKKNKFIIDHNIADAIGIGHFYIHGKI